MNMGNAGDQVFVLPPRYWPEKDMIHAARSLIDYTTLFVCRVTTTGEVYKFEGATLEDVAGVLLNVYHVDFDEMEEIWKLEEMLGDD